MKTTQLLRTAVFAALTTGGLAAETASRASSVTVNTGGDGQGKAVITIDVNGKKETREIDLGNATRIEIRTNTPAEKKKERVTYLGVAMAALPEVLADQLGLDHEGGVLVAAVAPESPAGKAGLQKNDVVVRLDDQPLKSMPQFEKLVSSHQDGDKITLHVIRRAQPQNIEVTLGSEERDAHPLDGALIDLGNAAAGSIMNGLIDKLGRGGSVTRKAIVIGPDGKVIVSGDPAKQMREAAESVEKALREAKIGEKTLDAVRDALDNAVKALDQARGSDATAREAAEVARKMAQDAQEKAERIRRELEERVRKELSLKHPDASKVPPTPLEKEP